MEDGSSKPMSSRGDEMGLASERSELMKKQPMDES